MPPSSVKTSSFTSYDMSDDCFLESDIQIVKEEVVGHSCQMCPKEGMDDEELKAHAVCHLEEHDFDDVAENDDHTKSTKSKPKRKRMIVNHIKCRLSEEDDSGKFVYSCTLCGMENIHVSLISAHMKKECILFLNNVVHTSPKPIAKDGNNYHSRGLSTINEGSSIFNANNIENYGRDNIIEEIVTLFNPLMSDIGVSTCDVSSLERQLLEVDPLVEQKTVSKESLAACIASAGDNTSLQSALLYESIAADDSSFRHLMENRTVQESDLFKCNYCTECFVSETDLLKHQEKWHADCQNILLCLICGKLFAKRNLLKHHVESHEAEPSTCQVCNKTFHNKMMLRTHTIMHTAQLPFKCSVCTKGFIFSSSLKKHLLKEHKVVEKDYHCNVCTGAFKTDRGLKSHVAREHGGGGDQHLCPTCGKTFSNSSSLGLHMLTHGPRKHVCEICDFRSHSKYRLKKHILRTHQRQKDFICETCGDTFYLQTELRRHVFNQHTDDLPSKCTHCDRAFKFPQGLQKHMISAHRIIPEGKQVYTCDICDQLFTNKSIMNDHMNLHSGARPYSCSDCNHKFRTKHSLMQHRQIHAAVRRPKNSFPCDVCNKKFKNERTWRVHNRVHLLDTEKLPSFECDECEKNFVANWMLNRHKILYHSGNTNDGSQRYQCDLCEEYFVGSGKLIKHKREIHLVEYPEESPRSRPPVCQRAKVYSRTYSCNQCEKTYPTASGLYQHKQRKHKFSNRKYPCKLCGNVLNSASALYLHGRCKHGLNPRDYTCETCGRKFKLRSSLNSHQLTHIEIKDRQVYTCPICSKDLTTKWSYEVHMRAHKGIKPHACDICGRTFTQSGDRNKHRLNTHKEIIQASELL